MNNDNSNPDEQNTNELEGLDPTEAAQHIHDEVRFALDDVTEAFDGKSAEYAAFRELLRGEPSDGVLVAHIPATTSEEEYLQIGVHLLEGATVIHQINVASTDTYCAYVGGMGDVLPVLAPHLKKEYIEVMHEGAAVELMREELDER